MVYWWCEKHNAFALAKSDSMEVVGHVMSEEEATMVAELAYHMDERPDRVMLSANIL